MPRADLYCDGLIHEGWTSVRVTRAIEQAAGTFELSLTERWAGQESLRPIRAGAVCRVVLDGHTAITGHVDESRVTIDAERHEITVSGRDKTGDLVDCAAVCRSGQWSGQPLGRIAKDLGEPFGVVVADLVGGEPFPTYQIQEGETVFETLERGARLRGCLVTSEPDGRLVLARAGQARVGIDLVLGENILSMSVEESWSDRFSEYHVKGQERGADLLARGGAPGVQSAASVRDGEVSRHRPMILLGEERGGEETLRERALWERNVRRGRGRRATVAVTGWTHPGGLWLPNRRVRLIAPLAGVDEELLIVSAVCSLDEGGSRTELSLARPEAYELPPGEKKKKEMVPGVDY